MASFRQNLESVVASGKKIAVASVGFYEPMMSVAASVEGGEEAFVVSQVEGSAINADSLARAAKAAKEHSSADFGAAVSQVETENGEKLVLVCLADSQSAWGAKVFADGDESTKALAGAAITKLCEMLAETVAAGTLATTPDTQKQKKTPWLPIIIIMIGVAAAVILALLVAFFFKEKSADTSVSLKGGANGVAVLAAEAETTSAIIEEETAGYRGGSGIGDEMELILESLPLGEGADVSGTVQQTQAPTRNEQMSGTQAQPPVASTTKPVTNPTAGTTKAPVSTTKTPLKPSTTVPKPTQPPTTKPEPTTGKTDVAAKSGTFVFTCYGWGHGVGMSQEGAISMAKKGSDYKKIIAAYFPGTTVKPDAEMPQTVKYGGVEYGIVEYLCKTSYREIGNSAPKEAIKAQIVAVYTFAKTYGFDVDVSRHAFSANWAYEGTATHKACMEVLDMQSADDEPKAVYVDYKGQPAFTCYFASSAGETASASSVWGGSYPYLCGGIKSPEAVEISEVRISSEEMRNLILDYDENIVLGDDPSQWITVVSHDGAYNSSVGYASVVRVGNKEMRGNHFRGNVCDYKLRSHCFTVRFISD